MLGSEDREALSTPYFVCEKAGGLAQATHIRARLSIEWHLLTTSDGPFDQSTHPGIHSHPASLRRLVVSGLTANVD